MTSAGGRDSEYVVNPRRSLKRTVAWRDSPPRRSSSSAFATTWSTTFSGTKRANRSWMRRLSDASTISSAASVKIADSTSAVSGSATGSTRPPSNATCARTR